MELKNVEIVKIGELKRFPNSEFYLVEFVVKTDEQYPQLLQLQANKDKADNLIKYNKVGDIVDCSINLRGREWTNPEGEVKYFNTLECWKVFKSNQNETTTNDTPITPQVEKVSQTDDDLPF